MSIDEFDLPQNYHSAIERIIQCKSMMKIFQTQLASKGEHISRQISSLEEKLVEMSIELASAKALEDERWREIC